MAGTLHDKAMVLLLLAATMAGLTNAAPWNSQKGGSWPALFQQQQTPLTAMFQTSKGNSLIGPLFRHDELDEVSPDGGCYYQFQPYEEGDRIVTNEPCLNCTCNNSMLMCYLKVCPFSKPIGKDCIVEKRPDQCCPTITCPQVPVIPQVMHMTTTPASINGIANNNNENSTELVPYHDHGCTIDNYFYPDGAQVPGNPAEPCDLCYCIHNTTACVRQECILMVQGCKPIFQDNICCPLRYDCHHEDDDDIGLITTTISPIDGTTIPPTTISPTAVGCKHNGTFFADGEIIPSAKPCEHCYCMKSDKVCAVHSMLECAAQLDNMQVGCVPREPMPGKCCPEAYDCPDDTVITVTIDLTSLPTTEAMFPIEASITATTEPSVSSSEEEEITKAPVTVGIEDKGTVTTVSDLVEDVTKAVTEPSVEELIGTENFTELPGTEVSTETSTVSASTSDDDHMITTIVSVEEISATSSTTMTPTTDIDISTSETEDMLTASTGDEYSDMFGSTTEAITDVEDIVTDKTSTLGNETDDQVTTTPRIDTSKLTTETSTTDDVTYSPVTDISTEKDISTEPTDISDKESGTSSVSPIEQTTPSLEVSCVSNGEIFYDGQEIPTSVPCQESCVCKNGSVSCEFITCPPGPPAFLRCSPVSVEDECCSTFNCPVVGPKPDSPECIREGIQYKEGEFVPSIDLCTDCYCIEGQIVCAYIECQAPAENCRPVGITNSTSCCPKKYICDDMEVDQTTSTPTVSISENKTNTTAAVTSSTTSMVIDDTTEEMGLSTTDSTEIVGVTESEEGTTKTPPSVMTDIDDILSTRTKATVADIPATTPVSIDASSSTIKTEGSEVIEEVPDKEMPVDICTFDGSTYVNGELVPPFSPCHESCKCKNGSVSCSEKSCPPPPPAFLRCAPVEMVDECCPTYSCPNTTDVSKGCMSDGIQHKEGEHVPSSDLCTDCYCWEGEIICAFQECPKPKGNNCVPTETSKGSCCPLKYECDEADIESVSHTSMTTPLSTEVDTVVPAKESTTNSTADVDITGTSIETDYSTTTTVSNTVTESFTTPSKKPATESTAEGTPEVSTDSSSSSSSPTVSNTEEYGVDITTLSTDDNISTTISYLPTTASSSTMAPITTNPNEEVTNETSTESEFSTEYSTSPSIEGSTEAITIIPDVILSVSPEFEKEATTTTSLLTDVETETPEGITESPGLTTSSTMSFLDTKSTDGDDEILTTMDDTTADISTEPSVGTSTIATNDFTTESSVQISTEETDTVTTTQITDDVSSSSDTTTVVPETATGQETETEKTTTDMPESSTIIPNTEVSTTEMDIIKNTTKMPEEKGSSCTSEGQEYADGESMPIFFSCQNSCLCNNGSVNCEQLACPAAPPAFLRCSPENVTDECCPTFDCPPVNIKPTSPECIRDGIQYYEGEFVPSSDLCTDCYCIDEQIVCALLECPESPNINCKPIGSDGSCCPAKYDCSDVETPETETSTEPVTSYQEEDTTYVTGPTMSSTDFSVVAAFTTEEGSFITTTPTDLTEVTDDSETTTSPSSMVPGDMTVTPSSVPSTEDMPTVLPGEDTTEVITENGESATTVSTSEDKPTTASVLLSSSAVSITDTATDKTTETTTDADSFTENEETVVTTPVSSDLGKENTTEMIDDEVNTEMPEASTTTPFEIKSTSEDEEFDTTSEPTEIELSTETSTDAESSTELPKGTSTMPSSEITGMASSTSLPATDDEDTFTTNSSPFDEGSSESSTETSDPSTGVNISTSTLSPMDVDMTTLSTSDNVTSVVDTTEVSPTISPAVSTEGETTTVSTDVSTETLEGMCVTNEQGYADGDSVPTFSMCQESCICNNGSVSCTELACPSPPPAFLRCAPVEDNDKCCPSYNCPPIKPGLGCFSDNGTLFEEGKFVPSKDLCTDCYCLDGEIICAYQECMLPASDNCNPIYNSTGDCCPLKYECDNVTATTEYSDITTTPISIEMIEGPSVIDMPEEEITDEASTTVSLTDTRTTTTTSTTEVMSSSEPSVKPYTEEITTNIPEVEPFTEKTTDMLDTKPSTEEPVTDIPDFKPSTEETATDMIDVDPSTEKNMSDMVDIDPTTVEAVTDMVEVEPSTEDPTLGIIIDITDVTGKPVVEPSTEKNATDKPAVTPSTDEFTNGMQNVEPSTEKTTTDIVDVEPTTNEAVTDIVDVEPSTEDPTEGIIIDITDVPGKPVVMPSTEETATANPAVKPSTDEFTTDMSNIKPSTEESTTYMPDDVQPTEESESEMPDEVSTDSQVSTSSTTIMSPSMSTEGVTKDIEEVITTESTLETDLSTSVSVTSTPQVSVSTLTSETITDESETSTDVPISPEPISGETDITDRPSDKENSTYSTTSAITEFTTAGVTTTGFTISSTTEESSTMVLGDSCASQGTEYADGEIILTMTPCQESCTCKNGSVSCTLLACPPAPPAFLRCAPLNTADKCCPTYNCSETDPDKELTCEQNGNTYQDGQFVPSSDLCLDCYCYGGEVICATQECQSPGDNCTPTEFSKGSCCPLKYECENVTTELPEREATEEPLDGWSTDPTIPVDFSTRTKVTSGVTSITTPMSTEVEGDVTDTSMFDTTEVTRDVDSTTTSAPMSSGTSEESFTMGLGESCVSQGTEYADGETVPTMTSCQESCTCKNGSISCTLLACPPAPPAFLRCTPLKAADECCPTYNCSAITPDDVTTESPETETTEALKDEMSTDTTITDELLTRTKVTSGVTSSTTPMSTEVTEDVTDSIIVDTTDMPLEVESTTTSAPMPMSSISLTTISHTSTEKEDVTDSTSEMTTVEMTDIDEGTTIASIDVETEVTTSSAGISTSLVSTSEPAEESTQEGVSTVTTVGSGTTESFTSSPQVTNTVIEEDVTTENSAILEPQTTIIPDVELNSTRTEEPTTDPSIGKVTPGIPGEGNCQANETTYENGNSIPVSSPCHESCICKNSVVTCELKACPAPPPAFLDCSLVEDTEQCCARYECIVSTPSPNTTESPGCVREDIQYSENEYVPSADICEDCYCMDGEIICAVQECPKPGNNCRSIEFSNSSCCPLKYECDNTTTLSPLNMVTVKVTTVQPTTASITSSEAIVTKTTATDLGFTQSPFKGSSTEPSLITDDSTDSSDKDKEGDEVIKPFTENEKTTDATDDISTISSSEATTENSIIIYSTTRPTAGVFTTEYASTDSDETTIAPTNSTDMSGTTPSSDVSIDDITASPLDTTDESTDDVTEVDTMTTSSVSSTTSTSIVTSSNGVSDEGVTTSEEIVTDIDFDVTTEYTTEVTSSESTSPLVDSSSAVVTTSSPVAISTEDVVTTEISIEDVITTESTSTSTSTTSASSIVDSEDAVTMEVTPDIDDSTSSIEMTEEGLMTITSTEGSIITEPTTTITPVTETTDFTSSPMPSNSIPESIDTTDEIIDITDITTMSPVDMASTEKPGTVTEMSEDGVCTFANATYNHGSSLPPATLCQESCKCNNGTVLCERKSCPPAPAVFLRCSAISSQDECCPSYQCPPIVGTEAPECERDGLSYSDGEYVPSQNECTDCYCLTGEIICAQLECTPPFKNCVPIPYSNTTCCPETYECDETTEEQSTEPTIVSNTPTEATTDNDLTKPSSTGPTLTEPSSTETATVSSTTAVVSTDKFTVSTEEISTNVSDINSAELSSTEPSASESAETSTDISDISSTEPSLTESSSTEPASVNGTTAAVSTDKVTVTTEETSTDVSHINSTEISLTEPSATESEGFGSTTAAVSTDKITATTDETSTDILDVSSTEPSSIESSSTESTSITTAVVSTDNVTVSTEDTSTDVSDDSITEPSPTEPSSSVASEVTEESVVTSSQSSVDMGMTEETSTYSSVSTEDTSSYSSLATDSPLTTDKTTEEVSTKVNQSTPLTSTTEMPAEDVTEATVSVTDSVLMSTVDETIPDPLTNKTTEAGADKESTDSILSSTEAVITTNSSSLATEKPMSTESVTTNATTITTIKPFPPFPEMTEEPFPTFPEEPYTVTKKPFPSSISSSSISSTLSTNFPDFTESSITTSRPDTTISEIVLGPGACLFDGKVYVSAQQIPRDDPCDFCFCFRGDIICLQQSCPPPIPGCYEDSIPGFCCPRYECPVTKAVMNITTTTITPIPLYPPVQTRQETTMCEIAEKFYLPGEIVEEASGPCLECICGNDGMMQCDPKQCQAEPMLRKILEQSNSSDRKGRTSRSSKSRR